MIACIETPALMRVILRDSDALELRSYDGLSRAIERIQADAWRRSPWRCVPNGTSLDIEG